MLENMICILQKMCLFLTDHRDPDDCECWKIRFVKKDLYDLSMTSPFRQILCLLLIDPRDPVITMDAEKYNLCNRYG